MTPTLTLHQLIALMTYAEQNGRTWKSKLNLVWYSGDYAGSDDAGTLQLIRNQFGPRWLARFRFNNLKTHKGLA